MSTRPTGVQSAHTPLSVDDPRETGGYRRHARLGAGGMGGRVSGPPPPGGRPVALKAVRDEFAADPEFRRRFADEVTSARSIHGLFTAQVVDSGVDAPTPWPVTAYVPGPSLQQVIKRTARCRCARFRCSWQASPKRCRPSTGRASCTGTSSRRTY